MLLEAKFLDEKRENNGLQIGFPEEETNKEN